MVLPMEATPVMEESCMLLAMLFFVRIGQPSLYNRCCFYPEWQIGLMEKPTPKLCFEKFEEQRQCNRIQSQGIKENIFQNKFMILTTVQEKFFI
jgi:hypothetical protein